MEKIWPHRRDFNTFNISEVAHFSGPPGIRHWSYVTPRAVTVTLLLATEAGACL